MPVELVYPPGAPPAILLNDSIQFALGEDRRYYHVACADLTPSHACPGCGGAVHPRRGRIRAWHYAHNPEAAEAAGCQGGGETVLHLMAKQILAEQKALLLPAAVARGRILAEEVSPETFLRFDEVRPEVRLEGFRPDLVMIDGGREMIVEIVVTHDVTKDKRELIRASGLDALKIDLSRLPRDLAGDELVQAVISGAPRTWIRHAARDARLPGLLAEDAIEVERRRVEEEAEAERRAAEEMERQLREIREEELACLRREEAQRLRDIEQEHLRQEHERQRREREALRQMQIAQERQRTEAQEAAIRAELGAFRAQVREVVEAADADLTASSRNWVHNLSRAHRDGAIRAYTAILGAIAERSVNGCDQPAIRFALGPGEIRIVSSKDIDAARAGLLRRQRAFQGGLLLWNLAGLTGGMDRMFWPHLAAVIASRAPEQKAVETAAEEIRRQHAGLEGSAARAVLWIGSHLKRQSPERFERMLDQAPQALAPLRVREACDDPERWAILMRIFFELKAPRREIAAEQPVAA